MQHIYLNELDTGKNSLQVAIIKLILGLSVEQVAVALDLTVAQVQQVIQDQSI